MAITNLILTLPCHCCPKVPLSPRRKRLEVYYGFPSGSVVKNPHAMQETQEIPVRSLGQEDPLKKEMATHSSIFAWKIPWSEEPGRLQPKVHKELDTTEATQRLHARARAHTHTHTHGQVYDCSMKEGTTKYIHNSWHNLGS
ncbi:unnamed protein product [Rangifer tarandus platyrhynchus]|uniref:Uncharacterized protein n=2 Tax=Rangifer tarandus platyrhynchus TaxID=3082113 RepID=A0ABN8YV20_RANTA|nr:unnamed protein product [Rangifer tarandus platyrhynchus]